MTAKYLEFRDQSESGQDHLANYDGFVRSQKKSNPEIERSLSEIVEILQLAGAESYRDTLGAANALAYVYNNTLTVPEQAQFQAATGLS